MVIESLNQNRVTKAIARMEQQIADRLKNGLTTQKAVDKCNKDLEMSWDEYTKFQTLKSLAVSDERLTSSEGSTIYRFLGESLDTFNKQPVHVKAVLTQVFQELLSAHVNA